MFGRELVTVDAAYFVGTRVKRKNESSLAQSDCSGLDRFGFGHLMEVRSGSMVPLCM